ncbi:dynamin family protein [Nocardioides caldifontis]|uniref:dynamin family protein n=1 Tax=Nocardioides caldifontis TaxID=2588938 RepID=UPI0011DF10ED|nr:dynamin family protein [Nocardioides caldifontis]
MAEELTARLLALAEEARADARTPQVAAELAEVEARLRGPVRLAIAGKVKAGKSTLLNAIVGEGLAPTDAGECTRIVTWYVRSDRPYVLLHPRDGEPVERPYARTAGALDVDLGAHTPETVHHLEVGWPSSRLDRLTLIDTPGIASISADVSARTHEVMSAEGGEAPVADAVLYLLRHTHANDIHFLEAFHDDEVAHGTPVNTVGVLSRADEIGASRLDAMEVASRVAARYQADPRLHRLCPMVVPVNGLLGHAAVTLREGEYAGLAAVARTPPEELAELLLTADRFATRDGVVGAEERTRLLDRLGLFGVRHAVELLRTGAVTSSQELAARLAATSGLDRLRDVVEVQFESRARVLKARSAVAALTGVLRRDGCGDSAALLRRLEEITSGAHEFEEVRILLELRAGEMSLADERAAQLDLLMGGAGHEPTTRLGLPPDAGPDEVKAAAVAALAQWRAVESHPLSSRPTQIAARAAARTIEGLLTA